MRTSEETANWEQNGDCIICRPVLGIYLTRLREQLRPQDGAKFPNLSHLTGKTYDSTVHIRLWQARDAAKMWKPYLWLDIYPVSGDIDAQLRDVIEIHRQSF